MDRKEAYSFCAPRIAIVITVIGFLLAGSSQAATLEVCPSGCAYSSIQVAINAASEGDTIMVQSGTYYENVNVNKRLTLQGIGMPVVDARGYADAITLSANWIRLEGFTATRGREAGILVGSYTYFNTLIHNNASNQSVGIELFNSQNNTLISNNVSNNYDGIYLFSNSGNNMLIGNNASNNIHHGIRLYNSNNNTISGNDASNHGYYGIFLMISDYNVLISNNASNNVNSGIYLYNSQHNIIYNNIFNNTNNLASEVESFFNVLNTTKIPGINIIGGPYLGGNFWANPSGTGFSQTCTDADSDGICDSNYTLNSNDIDYLPLTIPEGYSYIYGTVLNNTTGIAGATVFTNTSNITNTDASGKYSLLVPAGTYKLIANSEPRFQPSNVVTVTIASRISVLQDIELLKKPTGNISGSVSGN